MDKRNVITSERTQHVSLEKTGRANLIFFCALICLLISPYSRGIFGFFTGGMLESDMYYFASLFFFIFAAAQGRYKLYAKGKGTLLLSSVFTVVIPFVTWKVGFYQVGYMACILLVFLSENAGIGWVKKYMRVAFALSIFYSLTVIIQYLFTIQFTSGTLFMFSPLNQQRIMKQLSIKQYTGFTHQVAIVSCYLLAGLCCWADNENRVYKRKYKWVYFACLFTSLLLTGKRAHVLFSLVTFFVISFATSRKRSIKRAVLLFFALAFVIFLTTIFPYIEIRSSSDVVNVIKRIQGSFNMTDGVEGFIGGRASFWGEAIRLFRSNKFFGVGWLQYKELSSKEFNGHNVYLQLLAETGIVGFSLFMYMLMKMFINTYKLARKAHLEQSTFVNGLDRSGLTFSLCWQCFFLLYCLSGNPLYDQEYYVTEFIAYAIYFSVNHQYRIFSKRQHKRISE